MFNFLKQQPQQNQQNVAILPSQRIEQSMPNPVQKQVINDVLQNYIDLVKTDAMYSPTVQQYGQDTVSNGILQGLNFGNNDIAEWQKQYNAGVGREKPIKIPQNPQDVTLAQQNKFNNYDALVGDVAQTINPQEQARKNIFGKFINGAKDFQAGFKENANTPFSVDNWQPNDQKSNMYRIGEGFGTAGRFSASPAGRTAIMAGLTLAGGGTPFEALGYGMQSGITNQNARIQNQINRDYMNKLGYTTDNVSGYLTNDNLNKQFTSGLNSLSRNNITKKQYYSYLFENDLISKEKYDEAITSPEYDPNELVNINAFKTALDVTNPSKITKTEAQTKKLYSDIDLNKTKGEVLKKPPVKTTVSIRKGGTKSTVDINHNGNGGGKSKSTNSKDPLGLF